MIYLDNAATTIHKPPQVIEAVVSAMGSMGNSSRGCHSVSLTASRMIYDARCKTAELFGCRRPDNVVFTANSTEALNIAIRGIFSPGDHVISTDLEHNSVLRPLYLLEAEGGVSLSFLAADRQGKVDYGELEGLVRPETRAVVCTHASNLTGDLLDIRRIGRFTREHGLLFIADVSQTAGCFRIDMEKAGIDVLCFTGHKGMLGPQGTGGMCVREGIRIRPWKVGGTGVQTYSRAQPEEYPACLEAGTLNSHGLAGLSAAMDFLKAVGIENIHAREAALMRRFYDGIRDIGNVHIYGDFSTDERAAIVALNIGEEDSAFISDALAEDYGIATRSGAHCAPRMHEALGTKSQGAVRFSFSWYNTVEEADAAAAAVRELAGFAAGPELRT